MTNKEFSRRFISFVLALITAFSCFVFASADVPDGCFEVSVNKGAHGTVEIKGTTPGNINLLVSTVSAITTGAVTSDGSLTIKCTPDAGYYINATIAGTNYSSTGSNDEYLQYQIHNIATDVSIDVAFEPIDYKATLKLKINTDSKHTQLQSYFPQNQIVISNVTTGITQTTLSALSAGTSENTATYSNFGHRGEKVQIKCMPYVLNSRSMITASTNLYTQYVYGFKVESVTYSGLSYVTETSDNTWEGYVTGDVTFDATYDFTYFKANLTKTTFGSVVVRTGESKCLASDVNTTSVAGYIDEDKLTIECTPIEKYRVNSVSLVGTGIYNKNYIYTLTSATTSAVNGKIYTCNEDIKGDVKIEVVFEEDVDYNYTYRWYKVNTEDEMIEYLTRFAGTSESSLNMDPTSAEDAAHVLIVYHNDDGTGYYVTDDVNADGSLKMNSLSNGGIAEKCTTDASFFKTGENLGTPMIKITEEKNSFFTTDNSCYEYALLGSNNGTVQNLTYYWDYSGQNLGSSDTRLKKYTKWEYYRTYPTGRLAYLSNSNFNNNVVTQNTNHSRKYAVNLFFGSDEKASLYYTNTRTFPYYYNKWKYPHNVLAASIVTTCVYNISYINYFNYNGSATNPKFALNNAVYDKTKTGIIEKTVSLNSLVISLNGAGTGSSYIGNQSVYNAEVFSKDSSVRAGFDIYIGEAVDAPTMKQQLLDGAEGTYVLPDGTIIKKDTTIVVGDGQTLMIDGVVKNNGLIKLEGGKLIVRGVLTQGMADGSMTEIASADGFIESNHNGTIVILSGGCILPRHDVTLDLKNGSTLYVEGTIGVKELNVYNNSAVYIEKSGLLAVNYSYGDTQDQDSLSEGTKFKDTYPDVESITLDKVHSKSGINVDNSSRIFITGNYEETITSGAISSD